MSKVITPENERFSSVAKATFEDYSEADVPHLVAAESRQAPERDIPLGSVVEDATPGAPANHDVQSGMPSTADDSDNEDSSENESDSKANIKEIIELLTRERRETEGKIQEAYERGLVDGERHQREENRRLAEQYAYGLERLNMLGRTMETLARHEALEIALLIAKRIIQKEIELNPMILVEEVKRAVADTIGKKELTIRLNPNDLATVRELRPDLADHFPAIAQVLLSADDDLEPGDCAVDTEVEQINLSLEEQLSVLKRSIEEELT